MTASLIAEMSKQLGELDNALVRQKDLIYDCLLTGDLERAEWMLQFAQDLWYICNYDYKYLELRRIIDDLKSMDKGS